MVLAGGEGALSFFKEEVRIVADEISNSLVILATREDFEEIRTVLLDLDVVPRQVVLEVLIAEINLNKDFEMGVQTTLTNSGALSTTADSGGTESILGRVAGAVVNPELAKRVWESGGGGLNAIITDLTGFRLETGGDGEGQTIEGHRQPPHPDF